MIILNRIIFSLFLIITICTSVSARYYDATLSRWISVDPALQKGDYFPEPNDFDSEHDYFWYLSNENSDNLPGEGGIFNSANHNLYLYAHNNPVKMVDPDGNWAIIHRILSHPATQRAVNWANRTPIGRWAGRQGDKLYNVIARGGRWTIDNAPRAFEAFRGIFQRNPKIADNTINSARMAETLATKVLSQTEKFYNMVQSGKIESFRAELLKMSETNEGQQLLTGIQKYVGYMRVNTPGITVQEANTLRVIERQITTIPLK